MFLMDGFLLKKRRDSRKSNMVSSKYQKRFFQLTTEDLSYASSAKDFKGAGGKVEIFPLNEIIFVRKTDDVRIVIKFPHRILKLKADSEAAANLWVKGIEMAWGSMNEEADETRSHSNGRHSSMGRPSSSGRQSSMGRPTFTQQESQRSSTQSQAERQLEQRIPLPVQPPAPKVPYHARVATLDIEDSSDDEDVAYQRQLERQAAAARQLRQTQSLPKTWIPPSLGMETRGFGLSHLNDDRPPSPRSLLANPKKAWGSQFLKETTPEEAAAEERLVLQNHISAPAAGLHRRDSPQPRSHSPPDEMLILDSHHDAQSKLPPSAQAPRLHFQQDGSRQRNQEQGRGTSAGSSGLMDQHSIGSVSYVDGRNTRGSSAATGMTGGMLCTPPAVSSSDGNWLEEDFDSSSDDDGDSDLEDDGSSCSSLECEEITPSKTSSPVRAHAMQPRAPPEPSTGQQGTKPAPRSGIPRSPARQQDTSTDHHHERPQGAGSPVRTVNRAAAKLPGAHTPPLKSKGASQLAEDRIVLTPNDKMDQLALEQRQSRFDGGVAADSNFVEEDWDDDE